MGYRCRIHEDKAGECDFRLIEMVMTKKNSIQSVPVRAVITIDNHAETIRYVQSNMTDFVTNCVRVEAMETNARKKVEENARLFEQHLEPFFTVVAATTQKNVLDKLSSALKKALILMAMEKYHCNTESICKALGLSREKLEREIDLCGLSPKKRAV